MGTKTHGNEMADCRRQIVFRDKDYKELFRIKDGERIKITVAYDGEELTRKCRWLDDMHINVGSECYHVDELAGILKRTGNTIEPVPGKTPAIDVLIVVPGNTPESIEAPLTHAGFRSMLGGSFEAKRLYRDVASVTGKNGNGTTVICGLDKENGHITSLHPYEAQIYKRDFSQHLTAPVSAGKKTISERLGAAQGKASVHNASRKPRNVIDMPSAGQIAKDATKGGHHEFL